MSGAYAGLRLSARAGTEPDDETKPDEMSGEDEDETTSKKKDKPMTEQTDQAALDSAHASGFKAANDRMNAVFASEHYAGRETLAQTLLGNDKLSADEIVTVLAAAPKIEASPLALTDAERAEAAEEGGRKEMKAALAETPNSDIDTNGGGSGGKDEDHASLWDKAISANNPGVKLG